MNFSRVSLRAPHRFLSEKIVHPLHVGETLCLEPAVRDARARLSSEFNPTRTSLGKQNVTHTPQLSAALDENENVLLFRSFPQDIGTIIRIMCTSPFSCHHRTRPKRILRGHVFRGVDYSVLFFFSTGCLTTRAFPSNTNGRVSIGNYCCSTFESGFGLPDEQKRLSGIFEKRENRDFHFQ